MQAPLEPSRDPGPPAGMMAKLANPNPTGGLADAARAQPMVGAAGLPLQAWGVEPSSYVGALLRAGEAPPPRFLLYEQVALSP